MKRYFNVSGPCNAQKHYMLPTRDRCGGLVPLIEQEQYFVIHATRQSGKTTLLQDLQERINRNDEYYALYCSLESAQGIRDPKEGIPVVIDLLRSAVMHSHVLPEKVFAEETNRERYAVYLKDSLTAYCRLLDRPLVVLLDEVDCLSNGTLISFLRQLRDGYVNRFSIPFVHSLALVGMRNIRDYKARIRDDQETLGSASPFNIVTKSLTLRNFTEEEVAKLYRQHTEDTGQAFPDAVVSRAFHLTQGQPWLVNAIAREIVVEMLENDYSRPVKPADVEEAAQNIILRRDTHIDSLMERLDEERVRKVIEPVLLGRKDRIDFLDDDVQFVLDLGLLVHKETDLRPANPMYGDVIVRTLSYNAQQHLDASIEKKFVSATGIDVSLLLKEFQQFWRENSEIWVERFDYKEAAPHLIVTAYLQRVINAEGRILREYSAGRGRMDLCIEFKGHRYPVELKIRHTDKTIEEGKEQLSRYMETMGCNEGWLIIFDRRSDLSWDEKISWETVDENGKTLHLVGC